MVKPRKFETSVCGGGGAGGTGWCPGWDICKAHNHIRDVFGVEIIVEGGGRVMVFGFVKATDLTSRAPVMAGTSAGDTANSCRCLFRRCAQCTEMEHTAKE
jgi:hypothetical protein